MAGPVSAGSYEGTARAEIVVPIAIAGVNDLDFAIIVSPETGSTVTVGYDADNDQSTRICGLGLTCLGNVSHGSFNVVYDSALTTENFAGAVLDSDTIDILNANGDSMTVNNLLLEYISRETADGTTINSDLYHVYGTLNVGDNQAGGSYSGTYTVTVDYA